MALRLLPFRQYAESDVINMFALQSADVNDTVTDAGSGDNGVWVKVTQGGLNDGPVAYGATAAGADPYVSYLGVNPDSLPYVGKNQYPRVVTEVGVAHSGDHAIGCTLYQTAKNDENGEKLLYYPQKKIETQSVLPGESVPVLSRGIIAVACGGPNASGSVNSAGSLDITDHISASTDLPTADIIGYSVGLQADAGADFNKGQLVAQENDAVGQIFATEFGSVLATGSRTVTSGQSFDQFAGNPTQSTSNQMTGYYAIIQFDTNMLSTRGANT